MVFTPQSDISMCLDSRRQTVCLFFLLCLYGALNLMMHKCKKKKKKKEIPFPVGSTCNSLCQPCRTHTISPKIRPSEHIPSQLPKQILSQLNMFWHRVWKSNINKCSTLKKVTFHMWFEQQATSLSFCYHFISCLRLRDKSYNQPQILKYLTW